MTDPTVTLDDVVAQAEDPANRREVTARILLRQDLVARHAELDAALTDAVADDARLNRTPQAPLLAAQIRDLEAEIEAVKVDFTFQAIGRREWATLMSKHPPSKEHKRQFGQGMDHDPDTFPVAACAAACVKPEGMTPVVMQRLEKSLNFNQFRKLWEACLEANLGIDAPKSAAAGAILRVNGRSATTAAPEASPDPSSSDG